MQSSVATRKKSRTRSKSVSSGNGTPNANNGANLNGENVSEKEVLEAMEVDKLEAGARTVESKPIVEESTSAESKHEKPTKGRKRKASEMKANSILEEQRDKDKPTSNEKNDDEPRGVNESTSNDEFDSPTKLFEQEMIVNNDYPTNDLEPLGKGKRARIPNKRYSDFPLKTPSKGLNDESLPDLENGEMKDHVDSGSNSDASERSESFIGSPNVAALKAARISLSASPSASTHKKKSNIDLNNPNYLKPFQFGWKRELVYRATLDAGSNKRNGDIYYYTPNGRKVRSMREVAEHLKNKELTLEDFTFCKEPLGLEDPEKEIIRDAKNKSASGTPLIKKLTPKLPKTPKIASPKTVATPTSPKEKEAKVKNSPRLSGLKVKLPRSASLKSRLDKKTKEDVGGDMEVGTYPPNWSPIPNKKANKPGNVADGNKPCRPCSIRCQGVSGLIPNLQCRICLCLYHHECVGLASRCNIQGYVCKNCQLDEDQNPNSAATIAPPPLMPINALKSVTAKSTTLPKLKRIPKSGDATLPGLHPAPTAADHKQEPVNKLELPHLSPRPKFDNVSENKPADVPRSENKSIVGSVTTWVPWNSSIQMSDNHSVPPERPQFIEIIGDKRYLIVPKHSVTSVSPSHSTATAPAGNSGSENISCNIAGENLNIIDYNLDSGPVEPESLVKPDPSPNLSPIKSEDIPQEVDIQLTYDGADGDINSKEDISKEPLIGKQKQATASAKKKKRNSKASALKGEAESDVPEPKFLPSYLQNVSFGYNTLLCVFQYLKVQDLLRASCVCTMWRDIASHCLLWRTVRMKNSQIHSFEGLADALEVHGTVHLDLRKMLLPNNGNDDIWQEFSREIKKVDSLKKIELCRCPATVVEQLALSNPKLEVINAVTIKCDSMSLAPLVFLKDLKELRLKSTAGFSLTSDLTALADLKELKHLSLTSIKDLNKLNIDVIADLRNLESLDLGECADFPKSFGTTILARLTKLQKLRLEKGQGNCYTFELLEAVKNMPQLEQLELVNFDIKSGFDKALGACKNIKKLLIIPTYISQSATTNHMVMGGVLRLRGLLCQFVWGITLELLRVTELFVDQCEDVEKLKEKKEKKPIGNGDSIPVLKPVPHLKDGINTDIPPAQDPPQVEILPLPNLQKLLLQCLPNTKVKILKIPFHATWRQSITDPAN